MFEQIPQERTSFVLPFKLIAGSSGGLLVALGLCGLDSHLYPHSEFGGSILAGLGSLLFVISALGLFAGLSWLIMLAIISLFQR